MAWTAGEKVAVGAGAVALVATTWAAVVEWRKKSAAAPAPAPPPAVAAILAPGPYAPVAAFVPGETYLVSVSLQGAPSTLASDVKAMAQSGYVMMQAWDAGQVPPGWPASDADPNRRRFVVMGPAQAVPATWTAFATGGMTA